MSRVGFTLGEVLLSLSILSLMVLMVGAALPALISVSQSGSDYEQACQVAEHKIEELRSVGLSNPDASSLGAAGIIDSPQPVPAPVNPAGAPATAFSYTFTSVDALANYFSPGCRGLLTVAPDPNAIGADDVTVTISWQRPGSAVGSFVLPAKIVNG